MSSAGAFVLAILLFGALFLFRFVLYRKMEPSDERRTINQIASGATLLILIPLWLQAVSPDWKYVGAALILVGGLAMIVLGGLSLFRRASAR